MDDDASEPAAFALYRPRVVRLDVLPFVVFYLLGFATYLLSPIHARLANFATPLVACAHALTFLVCHWSLPVRCALQLRRTHRIGEATLVRARSAASGQGGRSTMCDLERRASAPAIEAAAAPLAATPGAGGAAGEPTEIRFEHRKRTYIYQAPSADAGPRDGDDDATRFLELTMPTSQPIAQYVEAQRGLRAEALAAAEHRFGPNSFAIPGRSFGSLFVEHALAPFFVFQVGRGLGLGPWPWAFGHSLGFLACLVPRRPHPPLPSASPATPFSPTLPPVQVFCVLLWSLDDYWYYSLFTLAMLVVFESTVVTSRLKNLDEMRELATPPSAALALRSGKWVTVSSESLVPGDIVALRRAPPGAVYMYDGAPAEVEATSPADVLLLHGSVTVNESALTGESTPMLKTPIDQVSAATLWLWDRGAAARQWGGRAAAVRQCAGGLRLLYEPVRRGCWRSQPSILAAAPCTSAPLLPGPLSRGRPRLAAAPASRPPPPRGHHSTSFPFGRWPRVPTPPPPSSP